MKKIFLLTFLISTFAATAQTYKSSGYKTGNYIFCGKEIPKNFYYLIEKKVESLGNNAWLPLAELHAPKNEAACKGSLLKLPDLIASVTNIEDNTIQRFWNLLSKSEIIDSLYSFASDPKYQTAAGCGWFDDGIEKAGTYQYRISKVSKLGEKTLLSETSIQFPVKPYDGKIKTARFRINESNITISYEIADTINTAGIKLYRSSYRTNTFSEISPFVIFAREEGKITALVTDITAMKNATYTYVAKAYDIFGNISSQPDTINIYNFTKASDIGIIEQFDASQIPEKKGVSLTWKTQNTLNVVSIDIFRSASYDGPYEKIASLPAKTTAYFDTYRIQPAIAYYYFIQINNGYGNSLPSARIPAILKGTKQNFLPPQNVTAIRNENIVTISFQKLGNDIRGYYVYRANGYTAAFEQLPHMLLSTDSLLTYKDTLPLTALPAVYSYAVASVNSSYNISPATERISVAYSGGMLPVPSKLQANLYDHAVFLIWENVSEENAAISQYKIFRSEMENGVEKNMQVIATTSFEENSFTDKQIVEGTHYRYRVQCIGTDSTDVGSISAPAGINIPEEVPLSPGSVSAYASENKIVLSWDLPEDKTMSGVRIYRATQGVEALLLKELPASSTQYEDVEVEKNTTYYYFIKTVNTKGKESTATDAVSGKIK